MICSGDISKSKDLSAERPEKVEELQALYKKWNAEQESPRWLASDNPEKQGKTTKKKGE